MKRTTAEEQYRRWEGAALVLIGNIGDVLLLEPCIRFLHERGLELDLFCTAETAMVWQGDSRLRSIIPIRSRNQKYHAGEEGRVRIPAKYDYLFDFWPTGRSVKLAWRIPARKKVTWTGLGAKRLLRAAIFDRRIDFPGLDILRAKVYLRLLGLPAEEAERWVPARIGVDAKALDHFWARFPQANPANGRFVVLQPTARWQRKLWAVEEWRTLLKRLLDREGLQVRMVSGPVDEEQQCLTRIAEGLVPKEHLFAGSVSWAELKCLLASSVGFVGLDSAPYHLAAMLGKPLVVLFGPTNEKEWGPMLPKQIVVKADDSPPTMAGISAEQVWRACAEAFNLG